MMSAMPILLGVVVLALELFLFSRLDESWFLGALLMPASLFAMIFGLLKRRWKVACAGLIAVGGSFLGANWVQPRAIQNNADLAGPAQVVAEGRAFMDEARRRRNDPQHPNQSELRYVRGDPHIPPALAKLGGIYVSSYGDSVEVKMYGLGFAGYVITPDDQAPTPPGGGPAGGRHLAPGLWWVVGE